MPQTQKKPRHPEGWRGANRRSVQLGNARCADWTYARSHASFFYLVHGSLRARAWGERQPCSGRSGPAGQAKREADCRAPFRLWRDRPPSIAASFRACSAPVPEGLNGLHQIVRSSLSEGADAGKRRLFAPCRPAGPAGRGQRRNRATKSPAWREWPKSRP